MEIILALAITLAIEVNLYMILDYKNLKLFVVVSIINIITNSSMNLILLSTRSDFYYYLILSIFNDIPLYECTIFYLSIYLLVDIWVVFTF